MEYRFVNIFYSGSRIKPSKKRKTAGSVDTYADEAVSEQYQSNKFIDVDCNKLDYKIISLKIKAELKKYNKNIDDSSIQLLSDYCIGDLSKILIECQKLVAFVGEKENITSLDIKEVVSRSLEYQIYELTDGLSRKDRKKVFTIINDIENSTR